MHPFHRGLEVTEKSVTLSTRAGYRAELDLIVVKDRNCLAEQLCLFVFSAKPQVLHQNCGVVEQLFQSRDCVFLLKLKRLECASPVGVAGSLVLRFVLSEPPRLRAAERARRAIGGRS